MQFTALFTLFQTTFGGNGTTTFALPDLRGTAAGNDGLRCVGTNFCICVEGGIYPPRGE
jgi:microcystin-dependent protein